MFTVLLTSFTALLSLACPTVLVMKFDDGQKNYSNSGGVSRLISTVAYAHISLRQGVQGWRYP